MIERGERVTMQAIRVFLASRSKPYSLKADQISFALKPLRDQKKVDSFTNGKRVKVDKKTYHSIRQAAREEGVAIETVRKRIRSESPEFKLWHYRSEEHTSELQSLMSISYAVFCLNKKK